MSGNSAFELVNERGWRRGLGNMLNSEMSHWWKTRRWWVNSLIWSLAVGLILGSMLFGTPGKPSSSEAIALVYPIFAGMIPTVFVIIMMQGAVVGEKKDGTAAWVLSKPLARPAFLLSKTIANSLGVLATAVIPPGVVAYILYAVASGTPWNFFAFLAALGVLFLSIFYFLSLTLMLGTFFDKRGPVIGIGLGLLLLQQYLVQLLPSLGYVLPWNLLILIKEPVDAVVPNLLLGLHNYSTIPIVAVAVQSILFLVIAVYRFNREEF
jgi:ABC-2 type transport system permease protein